MSEKIHLSEEVKDVISRATISGNSVILNGQLDRNLYLKVNKVLEAAGGKWNKKEKSHIFPDHPEKILGIKDISQKEFVIDEKQLFQEFFTPNGLAKRMVEIAGIKPGMKVLEPSAGHGSIADVAREYGGEVTCVEIKPANVDILKAKGHFVIEKSFLELSENDIHFGFDAILMNPPFSKNQDIDHVQSAFEWLGKNGILVAIMSPGFTFGTTKKRSKFREFVERSGKYEKLPEGTFKESGTNVNTVLVILKRE
jgi:predicted RNA methylase